MEFNHISVLLRESVDGLNIAPDGIYVDGTAGGAGHSSAIAERLGEKGRLIAFDRDPDAAAAGRAAALDGLTIVERLVDYRSVLAAGTTVTLKTDSLPLWRFSQTQFELAGYEMTWVSTDARSDRPEDPQTEYEQRLTAQGATVYALEGTPGPLEGTPVQNVSLSLVDYLPDDLEGIGYFRHGMQGSVTNLRNRERRRWARGGRK